MPNVFPWHLKRALKRAKRSLADEAVFKPRGADPAEDAERAAIRGILASVPAHTEPGEQQEAARAARRLLRQHR